MTSFAILLALVAFAPTQTMAKDPGGGQGRGHSGGGQGGGGQHGGGQQSLEQHGGGQQSVGQQGTGNARILREAGPNPSVNMGVGTNLQHSAGVHGYPQFPMGAGVMGTTDSWRYRSDNGLWWFWTPQNRWMWYNDGRWSFYRADDYYANDPNLYAVQRPILASPLPDANFSGGPIKITNPAANGVTLTYSLDGIVYTIPAGYSQDLLEDRAWVIQFSRGENLEQAQYGLQSGRYTFTSTDNGWELYRSELPTAR